MILITGGARGIGRYLTAQFAASGKKIIATYHSSEPDLSLKDVTWEKADVSSEVQVKALAEKHPASMLIHCAGISMDNFTHKFSTRDWDEVVGVNLRAAFLLSRHLLPAMREREFGRIVFISSVVPQIGVPGTPAYSAAKSGLWGLTRAISQENATKGITCNCINLGYFDIGMTAAIPEKVLRGIIDRIPMKRLGPPEDIFRAVQFAITAEYMTGSCVELNGGLA